MNRPRSSIFQDHLELDRRHIWATLRSWMEIDKFKRLRKGGKRKHHWDLLERALQVFALGLKLTGLYERGVRNAADIRLNKLEIPLSRLGKEFDGFTILHIADPHLDSLPGIAEKILSLTQGLEFDLCVFTGDYRISIYGNYRHVLPSMEQLAQNIKAREGCLAILGNHDTVFMVDPFEQMGIRVLANETIELTRGDESLYITGVDDPHYYYTPMASEALETAPDGCKIALIHSPELYDLAEEHNYSLYLTGHTHAGQIVLPDRRPIITHLHNGKQFAKGLWNYNGMIGYTSNGAGTSGIPIRFNTLSEITQITLTTDPLQ